MNRNIAQPSQTRSILKRYGFSFKKSLGQNFLINPHLLHEIVHIADVDPDVGVIEVGPGIGALTEQLAKQAGQVIAIEIDGRLIPILEDTLSGYPHVDIIHQDVLKTDLKELVSTHFGGYKRISVVANLPYYVTTPILFYFLESGVSFEHIVIMIQKEVATRIVAQPGTKEYGSLSIAVQYFARPRIEKVISNAHFLPRPNVDSCLVKLTMRTEPAVRIENEPYFFKVVRASFAQRRKTLLNNLQHNLMAGEPKQVVQQQLAQIGIDGTRRAESLTIEEFSRLSDHLFHFEKLNTE